jgi:hypothetical protein
VKQKRIGANRNGIIEADQDVLKRASASRSSGHWSDDDFDVLADPWQATDVDFSFRAPRGSNADPWLCRTRGAAMAAFARVGGGNEAFAGGFTRTTNGRPS